MNLKLYSIYDGKANEYGPLFEAKNNDVAIRKCKMEFRGVFGLEDFSLYCFGEFDHENGVLDDFSLHSNFLDEFLVCNLADLFNEEKKDK